MIDASVAAIVLAGGSSTRLGGGQNKVFAALGDRSVLELSLTTCARVADIATVVVVTRVAERDLARRAAARAGLEVPVVTAAGGATRLGSELAGLEVIRPAVAAGDIDVVVIHDGARPFATVDLFRNVIHAARSVGGGVPGITIREPTYTVAGGSATRLDLGTVVAVQTPQAFRARPLLAAYDRAGDARFDAVDTAQTIERYGDLDVAVVAGEDRNVKITFAGDLDRARAVARAWAAGRWT